MVDHSDAAGQRLGPVTSKTPQNEVDLRHLANADFAVLAPRNVVPLLRPVLDQSTLPHILPPEILAASRRVLRSVTSALLLAPALRNGQPHHPVAAGLAAVSGTPALFDPRLHLVSEKPRHAAQLLGRACVHGSLPADEILGVVIGHIWYFFSDVYPPLHNGSRPLDPPAWWCRLFEGRPAQPSTDGVDDMIQAGIRDAPVAEAR
ncbi:hypothetical protein PWT90_04890 [Aphanocladium album]|nr:hypothetical protein PWT90_04890 [Aphanocladium album]